MARQYRRQSDNQDIRERTTVGIEGVLPNPKLKLLDQVREGLSRDGCDEIGSTVLR